MIIHTFKRFEAVLGGAIFYYMWASDFNIMPSPFINYNNYFRLKLIYYHLIN